MAQPNRKYQDIKPDIRPNLRLLEGGNNINNKSTADIKALDNYESNPEKINNESFNQQELNGSNLIQGPWKNNTSDDNQTNQGRGFLYNFKKRGPIAVLISLLLGGGIFGIISLTPAGIAMQVVEMMTAFSDTSSPALRIRTDIAIANKFSSAFAQSSDGKCNIKCKFGTINETTKKNLEDKGFKIDAEKNSLNRYSITKMTFPDGKVVNSGAEYKEAMKDIPRAASFKKAFNSKTAFFINSKFGSALKNKFGLDKLAKITSEAKDKVTGEIRNSKDNAKNSMRKSLGLTEIDMTAPKLSEKEKAAANPKFKEATNNINKVGAKYSKFDDIANGMCAIYNISKGMSFAIKTAKIASFAGFAMIFLTASDQIKAGDGDADAMSVAGDILALPDENGETATSSQGYRMATYGDQAVLSAEDQKYSSTVNNESVNIITALTNVAAFGGLSSLLFMNQMCIIANNPSPAIQAIIDAIGNCPDDIMLAIMTLGGAAILSLAKCIIKVGVFTAIASAAINLAIKSITENIIKGEVPNLDEDTKGSAAGNAIYSGSANILGGKAATYGLKAGNKNEIRQYSLKTAAIRQQENAIAAYEAKNTPFDINNQYSFVGSLAKTLGIANLRNFTTASYLNNIFSFMPKSFATLSNNSYADASNKADLYDNQCSDANLKLLKIDADAFCNPSYVMSDSEIDSDTNNVVQYMINKGFINEDSGEAISGSKYKKYLDNCANRVEPLSETATGIEDPEYVWKLGWNCSADTASDVTAEELNNFHTYTMDKAINDTIDTPYEGGGGSGTAAGTTIDVANLYQPSDTIACAPGTTEAVASADGYTDGNLVKIKLCYIPNTSDSDSAERTFDSVITVNSRVSGAWLALINEMRTATGDNIISASSSFRTPEMQATNPGGAAVGYSNHQMGLAVDFGDLYGPASWGKGEQKYYDFLSYDGGGAKYGFNQLSGEAWHWEPIH